MNKKTMQEKLKNLAVSAALTYQQYKTIVTNIMSACDKFTPEEATYWSIMWNNVARGDELRRLCFAGV